MSNEPINLAGLTIAACDDIAPGDVWIGDVSDGPPSKRLIEAFARGETTEGGMAEAGWRMIGTFAEDGITFTPNAT